MSTFETRLLRAEDAVISDLKGITLAFIFSEDEVRYGSQVMTLDRYMRDVHPGVKAQAQKHFQRTGEMPITSVDFRGHDRD